MQDENGSIINQPQHGYTSQDIHYKDTGGRHWRRLYRDICGVLTMRVETSGVLSGRVTGEVTKPGNTQEALHV